MGRSNNKRRRDLKRKGLDTSILKPKSSKSKTVRNHRKQQGLQMKKMSRLKDYSKVLVKGGKIKARKFKPGGSGGKKARAINPNRKA